MALTRRLKTLCLSRYTLRSGHTQSCTDFAYTLSTSPHVLFCPCHVRPCSENEAPSCMAHVGRAIYEAQKLEQQLKAEEVAEAEEAGTPPGPPLQQHLPQVEQPSDGDVERRLPIIVDVVPGQVGGFKGKKLLVPEQTSVALLAVILHAAESKHAMHCNLACWKLTRTTTACHPQTISAFQGRESATVCSRSLTRPVCDASSSATILR